MARILAPRGEGLLCVGRRRDSSGPFASLPGFLAGSVKIQLSWFVFFFLNHFENMEWNWRLDFLGSVSLESLLFLTIPVKILTIVVTALRERGWEEVMRWSPNKWTSAFMSEKERPKSLFPLSKLFTHSGEKASQMLRTALVLCPHVHSPQNVDLCC